MTSTLHRSTLTVDWVGVEFHSLSTPAGEAVILDEQDVFIAVMPGDEIPDSGDLQPAEWVREVDTTRAARAMFGPLEAGTYTVWGQVVGGSWTIVERAYTMTVA